MLTVTLGRMPASSQASSELSTASLTVVRRALRGLSKPRRWRFLAKNSETEISRALAMLSGLMRSGAALTLTRSATASFLTGDVPPPMESPFFADGPVFNGDLFKLSRRPSVWTCPLSIRGDYTQEWRKDKGGP